MNSCIVTIPAKCPVCGFENDPSCWQQAFEAFWGRPGYSPDAEIVIVGWHSLTLYLKAALDLTDEQLDEIEEMGEVFVDGRLVYISELGG